MALRSQLGLWCYTPPSSSQPLIVQEYGERIEALEFTTVAPGGFGDLACVLKLADARLPRPELAIFAPVCLRDGPFTVFSGEWSDPSLVMDAAGGDHVLLSALGGGVALRDDPDESSYASKTAQFILAAEFAKRSAYLAIDSDLSAVLPTNPVATFSPIYDGYALEEILHDLAFALGDYMWCAWDHPTHVDAAGFPTRQVVMHARDTATTGYLALGEDITSWRVMPSQQRAYNCVEVCYVDTTGGPATVTVSDPRLNGDGSQGKAPFRRRKLRRSLGRSPLTSAQATTIANAYLAAYQNVTNKVQVELRAVRDPNGRPIPLSHLRADGNLFVPELAVRGQTLTGGPVPGVNQFYIVESIYRETADDVKLTLMLDNYADQAGALIAQLKLAYDASLRARGTTRQVISAGVPVVGSCGGTLSNQTGGATVAVSIPFPGQLANAPTSVTINVTSSTNATGVTATSITKYGFMLQWTTSFGGATSVLASYQTVGN